MIAELGRALPPRPAGIVNALRTVFPDETLQLDARGGIATPTLRSARDLAALEGARRANQTLLPRLGRCEWLDEMEPAPLDGDVKTAQDWLSRAVKVINRGLSLPD